MITDPRERGFPAKQEDKASDSKITKASSSSRSQWSGLKDPRVVRVSRAFGGKDRHSKVCTIRGLRDRRVRLSVPTAIQLYDLQDRLGLNQPSKVVDWLLNVAKNEIDELPPLPISPGHFTQYPQSMISSHDQVTGFQPSLASLVDANLELAKEDHSSKVEDQTPKSAFWNLNAPSRSEDVARESVSEKTNWMKRNEQENQGVANTNSSSFSGLLNNVMPYNSYYHWDASNLSLSHLGSHGHGFSIQPEDAHNNNYNLVPQLSLPPSSQLFFSPYVATQVDSNPRQINNHLQMLSSTSQNFLPNIYPLSQQPMVRPLQLGLTPNFLSPQNHNASQSNKESTGGTSFPNDPKSSFG